MIGLVLALCFAFVHDGVPVSGGANPVADWQAENAALRLRVSTDDLALAVTDKRTGRTWRAPGLTNRIECAGINRQDGSRLEIGFRDVASGVLTGFRFQLDEERPDELTVSVVGKGKMPSAIAYPSAFALESGDWAVLPYGEGCRVPFGSKAPVHDCVGCCSGWISMPFFGLETASGAGVLAIFETPDDALVNVKRKDGAVAGIYPEWAPSRGAFGSARRIRYVFLSEGGYVRMAKRYRAFAREQGYLKTFAQKAVARPRVKDLIGAANVWYFQSKGTPSASQVAAEMKAAGIDRFLWSQAAEPEEVKAIAAMPGVLAGRYDCYRDVYYPELLEKMKSGIPKGPGEEICRNTSAWPDDVIWRSGDSNDWQRAWNISLPGGGKMPCAALCALCQAKHLRQHLEWEMARTPYTARFIDVTTAHGWEECENPAHPATRSQARAACLDMLGMMSKDYGLVVGSEQGMDVAVPVCDYFEGMMSPGWSRLPHGRAGAGRWDIFREGVEPQGLSKGEIDRFRTYGIGEKYRIPLFELVYHDCCCAHWYWYDYSNRPIADWSKRDCFNALYGTSPMYVFNYWLWKERKETFVKSYRRVAPIARATGFAELLDHRALTEDARVQRSVFADGTEVTVDFGADTVEVAKTKPTLFFAGDSTLDDHGGDESTYASWGSNLRPFLADGVRIVNYAKCGRSTKSFVAEGWWGKILNEVRPGDFVFIQFGHNDQKVGQPNLGSPVPVYAANLKRMISEVRLRGALPVLGTPIVRLCFSKDGKISDGGLDEWAAAAREVAKSEDVPLVDMRELGRAKAQAVGRAEALTWNAPNDATHPAKTGAQVYAKLFLDEVKARSHAMRRLFK